MMPTARERTGDGRAHRPASATMRRIHHQPATLHASPVTAATDPAGLSTAARNDGLVREAPAGEHQRHGGEHAGAQPRLRGVDGGLGPDGRAFAQQGGAGLEHRGGGPAQRGGNRDGVHDDRLSAGVGRGEGGHQWQWGGGSEHRPCEGERRLGVANGHAQAAARAHLGGDRVEQRGPRSTVGGGCAVPPSRPVERGVEDRLTCDGRDADERWRCAAIAMTTVMLGPVRVAPPRGRRRREGGW